MAKGTVLDLPGEPTGLAGKGGGPQACFMRPAYLAGKMTLCRLKCMLACAQKCEVRLCALFRAYS
jgi:hypothetical protein